MRKLVAIVCVISWSGFWAFGYLAVSAADAEPAQVVTAALIAAAGALTGVFAWLWLAHAIR
jgi:hypothetical protein